MRSHPQAPKFDDYWRLWNLPVHNWLLRHIFFPCLNFGLGRATATGVVFFVSAALHELLVSGPCARLRRPPGIADHSPQATSCGSTRSRACSRKCR